MIKQSKYGITCIQLFLQPQTPQTSFVIKIQNIAALIYLKTVLKSLRSQFSFSNLIQDVRVKGQPESKMQPANPKVNIIIKTV